MAPKRRKRLGHIIGYRIEFYVPGEDETRARVACQHWLTGDPIPEGYPQPRFQEYSTKKVREVIARPACKRCDGTGRVTVDGVEETCPRCSGFGTS